MDNLIRGFCGYEIPKVMVYDFVYSFAEILKEGGINTILYYIPANDNLNGYVKTFEELDFIYEKGLKVLVLMYWGMEPSAAPNNVNRIPAAVEAHSGTPGLVQDAGVVGTGAAGTFCHLCMVHCRRTLLP